MPDSIKTEVKIAMELRAYFKQKHILATNAATKALADFERGRASKAKLDRLHNEMVHAREDYDEANGRYEIAKKMEKL